MSKIHGRISTHCVRLSQPQPGEADCLVSVEDAINAATDLAGLVMAATGALPDDHRRKSIETGAEILLEALHAIGDRIAAINLNQKRGA